MHSAIRVGVWGNALARGAATSSLWLAVIALLIQTCSVVLAQYNDPTEIIQRVKKLADERKYQEAIPIQAKLVEDTQRILGLDHPGFAATINNLAFLYFKAGEYAKAEPLYQQALLIRQKTQGPDHPDTIASLNNLASFYYETGEYAKAQPLCQLALDIERKILDPDHPDIAVSLNSLAQVYFKMADYAKAEPLYQQALQIRQRILGVEHPDTAVSLNNLANLYFDTGDYAKAESLYQQALQVRQRILGPEHPDTVVTLDDLATVYDRTGDLTRAEPLYKEVLRIRQKISGPDQPDAVTSLSKLATLYFEISDYAKAEELFLQALQIRQKTLGSEHPDTVLSIDSLAFLYLETGQFSKSESLFQQALKIEQKIRGPDHPDTAWILSNSGLLYLNLRDYAKALPLLERALQSQKQGLDSQNPAIAMTLDYLGRLYIEKADYAKAEPLLQEALGIQQKVLGPRPVTAVSLTNLAALYLDMDDYVKAKPLLQQALEIQKKILGPINPLAAVGLYNLAIMNVRTGDYATAEPLLEQSFEMNRKLLGLEHPFTLRYLGDLALTKFELGKLVEAKELAKIKAPAELDFVSKILSFTSEQQRLAFLANFDPYQLFALLDSSEADLAAAVLHYKGAVLDSVIEDRRIAEASQDGEDRVLVDHLQKDKQQLGTLLLQNPQKASPETSEHIQRLEEAIQQTESQLALHVASLGQTRQAFALTVGQIKSAIPDKSVLVEYVRYGYYLGKGRSEPRYAASVFVSKGAPLWIPLGKAADIEALVRRYQILARRRSDDDELTINLQSLWLSLWSPIEQVLPNGIKRVIISPDGQLNFLSFATLLDREKHFIAENYSIQYAASGRDLVRELQPPKDHQVVLLANPEFDKELAVTAQVAKSDLPAESSGVLRGAEKREIADLSFLDLAGAQKESDKLSSKFQEWGWSTVALTGVNATKRALMEVHSPYILHLATHGFFEPADSSSDIARNRSQTVEIKGTFDLSRFFEDPMRGSGLALAGANSTIKVWKRGEAASTEEDGILTAEDVSTLDLKGTWLVTLSACDTGSGEARAGEGVLGLRRGFVEAGAQNLLMTLWPISDEITVQIMSDFYEAAHKTGNAPKALAKVQRNWLIKLRTEKGLAQAVNLAGPFIMSSQGKP
jgi:tetratricopeptide (TPR) repeat protein